MATKRPSRSKRPTKAQKMKSGLWKASREGPFTATLGITGNATQTNWARSTGGGGGGSHFQPSNADSIRVTIDTQHARALQFGHQTATQFGYGVVDVQVDLVPSYGSANPDNSRAAFGEVLATWYEPTGLRMDALKHLKDLERMEDNADPFATGVESGDAPEANPLLAFALDTNEETGNPTNRNATPLKGSRIIRFGFRKDHPEVHRQSQISVDLNADGDLNDGYEQQPYFLSAAGDDGFGILQRMEQAVNPIRGDPDEQTFRKTEFEWAHPIDTLMVSRASSQRQQMAWSGNAAHNNNNIASPDVSGGLMLRTAYFNNLRCVGGLIGLQIPRFYTSADAVSANNDFTLLVTVKGKKWVSM